MKAKVEVLSVKNSRQEKILRAALSIALASTLASTSVTAYAETNTSSQLAKAFENTIEPTTPDDDDTTTSTTGTSDTSDDVEQPAQSENETQDSTEDSTTANVEYWEDESGVGEVETTVVPNDTTVTYDYSVDLSVVSEYNTWQTSVNEAQQEYENQLNIYNEATAKAEAAQARLQELETDLANNREILTTCAASEYKYSNDSFNNLANNVCGVVAMIFSSKSFSELENNLYYYEKATNAVNEKVELVISEVEEQKELTSELEQEQAIAQEALTQAEERKTQLETASAQLQQLVDYSGLSYYTVPEVPAEGYDNVIQAAYSRLGLPYVWGGKGENDVTFDCSGLTQWCYLKTYGINIGINTSAQYANGTKIPVSEVQPGDVLFRNNANSSYQHVAIYIGGGKYIHAPGTGKLITIGSGLSNWTCALRFVDTSTTLEGLAAAAS